MRTHRPCWVLKSLPTCPAELPSAHLGAVAWPSKVSILDKPEQLLIPVVLAPYLTYTLVFLGRSQGKSEGEKVRGIKNVWGGDDSLWMRRVRGSLLPSPLCSRVGITRLWQGIFRRKKEERCSKPSTGALWLPSLFWIEWIIDLKMCFAFQTALVLGSQRK